MELERAVDENLFFESARPKDRPTLPPHKWGQASLSTAARGTGVASATRRHLSAKAGSLHDILRRHYCGYLDRSSTKLRSKLPATPKVLVGCMRELAEPRGVTAETQGIMASREGSLNGGTARGVQTTICHNLASRYSRVMALWGRPTRRMQGKLGKLVKSATYNDCSRPIATGEHTT